MWGEELVVNRLRLQVDLNLFFFILYLLKMDFEWDFIFEMVELYFIVYIFVYVFIYKNGNVVIGEVEICYCEYWDVVDIVFLKILMIVDFQGEEMVFNLVGMFEIRVYQNGEEFLLKLKNFLKVDYWVIQLIFDFYFWKLDDMYWNDLGKFIDFEGKNVVVDFCVVLVEIVVCVFFWKKNWIIIGLYVEIVGGVD